MRWRRRWRPARRMRAPRRGPGPGSRLCSVLGLAPVLFALAAGTALAADCKPLETRDPNGEGQRPAFEGQTRACGVKSEVAFDVMVVARGLDHPWAVEPLP